MSARTAGNRISQILLIVANCAAMFFLGAPAHGQSGFFEGSIAFPLSESGVTFSKAYDGQMHTGLSYTHVIQRHFRIGVSMEYARFLNAGQYDIHMNFLMPSVIAVYGTHFSGRHRFEASLQGGNAWISYQTDKPDFPNIDESGPYVSPGIRFVFQATEGLKAQMGVGYKVVFEHFRDDSIKEDGTIRYLVFGTGLMLGI